MNEPAARQIRHAPATARNREPILAVLTRVAPREGLVLELASGSGEHAVFLGPRLSEREGARRIEWQPSDPDASARASIDAWIDHERVGDVVRPAVALDAADDAWPLQARSVAMVVCINMIHIAPWAACEGMLRGASKTLIPKGILYLYGPYWREGIVPAESNVAFDASLRARDPAWGIRDLEAVRRVAETCGFVLKEVVEMPANNLSVVFERI